MLSKVNTKFTLLLLFFSITLFSQSNLVPHQWIVCWDNCAENRAQIPSGLTFSMLSSLPMKLSLLTSDPSKITDEDVEHWLRQNSCVGIFQRNHYIESRIVPNDPLFTTQYHHVNNASSDKDLDSDLAWNITTGGVTVLGDTAVICVVDNGINAFHPDLINNMWKNYQEIPGNGIDDDNNGYTDDFYGWSVETKNDSISNNATHGTSVAGVIAAEGNNNIGVAGMMWKSKIMFVDYDTPTEANAISAYSYPFTMRKLYNQTKGEKGAYVIATNSSWGRDRVFGDDAPLWCAMYDSLGSVGIINIAATSNSNVNVDIDGDMPTTCSSPYLIAVSNLSSTDMQAGAGYGRKNIDINVYGQNIRSTSPTDYGSWTGTSLSTPLLTGAIGLMYTAPCAFIPTLSLDQPSRAALITKNMVLKSAIPIPSLERQSTTDGKLNAHRLISNVISLCESCNQITDFEFTPSPDALILNWQSVGDVASINVRYRPVDELTWRVIENFFNGDSIQGLKYCTEYEVQLQNKCGFTSSEYGYSSFVTSTACCKVIKEVKENVSNNELKISWTYDTDASFTDVYFRKVGDETFTLSTSDSNFIIINGLGQCNKYEYYLIKQCPLYDKASDASEIYTATTDCGQCSDTKYCLFDMKDAKYEWIKSTTLDSIKIVDHNNKDEDGYEDFIGITSTDIERGKTYTCISKFGYLDDIVQDDYYRLYIDWNGDGLFSDDEEMAKLTDKVKDSITTVFTCPMDAKLGNTRMRQILSYDDFKGSCDDAVFDYGEIEDFCIKIIDKSASTDIQKAALVYPSVTHNQVSCREDYHFVSITNADGTYTSKTTDLNARMIDLSNLPNGVYIVTIADNQKHFKPIKVIKI